MPQLEDKLKLYRVDCRTMRLLDPKFIEVFGEGKEIIKLQRPNSELEISVGSVIKFNKDPQRVNIILRGVVEGRVYCYDLKSSIPNVSTLFVTPLLGFTSKNAMFWDSLVNTFISTPKHDISISLLYRFNSNVEFTKYETNLVNLSYFIEREEPDPYHTLYVFNVPDHALSAYNAIRTGKYSEVPDLWKLCILDFHNFNNTGHTAQILYKDIRLKTKLEESLGIDLHDAELHSIPDMKYERYNPEYYLTKLKM